MTNKNEIIELALKHEHEINQGKKIILTINDIDYQIKSIPTRQVIWDSFTNRDKILCPCCVYNYITIFNLHIRYKVKELLKNGQYTLEDLIPLCYMCYELLGDRPYKAFKDNYDKRYKDLFNSSERSSYHSHKMKPYP